MTLRRRLLLSSLTQIGLLGLVFFALGFFLKAQVLPLLEEHLTSKTSRAAHALATEADVALATSDAALLARITSTVENDPDFAGLAVWSAAGVTTLTRGTPIDRAAVWGHPGAAVETRGMLAAWAPVSFEGMKLGAVAVAFSRDRLRAVSRGMTVLGLAAIAALAAATVVAFRFSAAFVAPIGTMMDFSRKVAEGKLRERLVTSAEGELAQLVTHLNAMTSALESRDTSLAQRQAELESSLAELRQAQDELMQSTRLASVGEMAGRTAHEVLNPVTSIRGRVTKLLETDERVAGHNRRTFESIISGWESAWAKEGLPGLVKSLEAPVAGPGAGPRTLIEEDLANLRGLLRYFSEKAEADRKDLQFLLAEVDRVVHIIDAMRSLTRQRSTVTTTPVADVVREAMEIARDGASKRNIEIEARLDAEPLALLDRYELLQVLTNLLRNAMQAIEEKRGRAGGHIGVRVESTDDKVTVHVEDDGTGIKPEHLPFVFESGFTTRPAREGTGLGLPISRRLARGFGGDLCVEETRPGQGCTFRLDLPRLRPEQSGRPDREPHAA